LARSDLLAKRRGRAHTPLFIGFSEWRIFDKSKQKLPSVTPHHFITVFTGVFTPLAGNKTKRSNRNYFLKKELGAVITCGFELLCFQGGEIARQMVSVNSP
jgi:hypothetical protein